MRQAGLEEGGMSRTHDRLLTPQEVQILARLGSATIHEAQGQKGALDPALKPLDRGSRLVGQALTVDCRPSDNLVLHLAVTKARPGDVLVVDSKGFTTAGPWGDILTLAAQQAGIAGLVIDGAVRDSASIIETGFPVFARGLSIYGTLKNQPGTVNQPILCGGQCIRPGDVVVGDADGLVVIAADELDAVVAASVERERKEAMIRKRILAGETTVEILGLQPTLDRLGMK